jgi:hypothetical protein
VEFAPGMAAMLASFAERSREVLEAFRARLEIRFGRGPVALQAKAFIAQVKRIFSDKKEPGVIERVDSHRISSG